MAFWRKKILAVMLQWDYGQEARGTSIEKACFFSTLRQLAESVEPLWYDDYLSNTVPLQDVVIARAQELRPDLIFFIPYNDEFTIETLDKLRKITATYAWFGDDQWRFDDYTSKFARHFTYVSTTDPWSIPKYRKLDIEPIATQWAAQPYSDAIGPLCENEKYVYDVSFLGGYNPYREWFIRQLEKQGIKVTCFGYGWPAGRVSNEQMEHIFRKSRINLNISNSASHDVRFILGGPRNFFSYIRSPKRVQQMKARNFEIPLAGGFQLANYVLGLERYLNIGDEIAVYNTPEECAAQIEYYLENEDERMAIVARSHGRARNEHTYSHRLEHILEHIWG